jgi:hypothetical protein
VKRTVPLLITALVGFVLLFSYVIPVINGLNETALAFGGAIGAFGALLGAASLLRLHGDRIRRRSAGWAYSVVTLVGFFATMIVAIPKLGVPPHGGLHALLKGPNGRIAEATLVDTDSGRKFEVKAYGGEPNEAAPVTVNGLDLGTLTYDKHGVGTLRTLVSMPREPGTTPISSVPTSAAANAATSTTDPAPTASLGPSAGSDATFVPAAAPATTSAPTTATAADPHDLLFLSLYIPPNVRRPDKPARPFQPVDVQVGTALRGELRPYSFLTGDAEANGSPAWYSFEYVIKPLTGTMFAMLAFYMASAAFRAFRARNTESVLLLVTAFVILLGRTAVGAWLTHGLPTTGVWSFFDIPNLTSWIMIVFNTAGNRAIMIGIALGIAATSMRILLGIDRSYLGSDKG